MFIFAEEKLSWLYTLHVFLGQGELLMIECSFVK